MLHNTCFIIACERKITMPPKPKYTKEEIINVALDMVREKGADSLTARDLGAKLGTSSRPIFTAFENMEDLKNAVTDAIQNPRLIDDNLVSAYMARRALDYL